MSTRKDHLKKFVKLPPRLTPFELGRGAYATAGSLKGLPYGPGWRQEEYIRGFLMARFFVGGFKDHPDAMQEAA